MVPIQVALEEALNAAFGVSSWETAVSRSPVYLKQREAEETATALYGLQRLLVSAAAASARAFAEAAELSRPIFAHSSPSVDRKIDQPLEAPLLSDAAKEQGLRLLDVSSGPLRIILNPKDHECSVNITHKALIHLTPSPCGVCRLPLWKGPEPSLQP